MMMAILLISPEVFRKLNRSLFPVGFIPTEFDYGAIQTGFGKLH